MARTYEYRSESGKTASVYVLQDVLAKPEGALVGSRILCHAMSADGLRPADLADIRARHPEGTLYAVRVMAAPQAKGKTGGSRWGAEASKPAPAVTLSDNGRKALATLQRAGVTGDAIGKNLEAWRAKGLISADDVRLIRETLTPGEELALVEDAPSKPAGKRGRA